MTERGTPRGLVLQVSPHTIEAQRVLKALGSVPRQRILALLRDRILNVSEIAAELAMPLSTANMHVQTLEAAGLLLAEHQPAVRGSQKICARAYDTILIELPQGRPNGHEIIELSMPVGGYVDCQVEPSCGLASETGIIGLFDDAASFYEPGRAGAQLVWFHHGFLDYRFPNRLPPTARVLSLHLSLELCSEAPLHHDEWPSDITVWINGVEVGSWTSPADFGGQRGTLTPPWWETHNSQFGLLKIWQVNREASLVDGMRVSDVTLDALDLGSNSYIAVRIGVKPDARHVGGINIFGRGFGNYPQDIMMRLHYT